MILNKFFVKKCVMISCTNYLWKGHEDNLYKYC